MEASAPVPLAGAEIHGFHSTLDLDVGKTMEEACSRWLRPNEIHAILYNYKLFTINVKPMNLPTSGTIVLFDRKMLRNFRRDGHSWKKKKDGKTVKEAHEHLKVGNEERIHVYYAHGEDNPTFVRRCYWLLDKKYEHIVLVHYRETLEVSPLTPVNSSCGSSHLDTSVSRILSEETDTGGNQLGSTHSPDGESHGLGNDVTVVNHDIRLHEINTLEWEDLLLTNDPKDFNLPRKDGTPCLGQQQQDGGNESMNNGNLFPSNNIPEGLSSFAQTAHSIDGTGYLDAKVPIIGKFDNTGNQMSSNIQSKELEMVKGGMDGPLDIVKEDLQTQDSFGRWMSYIMTDSPGSLDDLQVGSPLSTGQSSSSTITDQYQSSIQGQIFSITDVSPAWAFSTEETKVIMVGHFLGTYSNLAESNLLCVFGDLRVPAEVLQAGVFRCMALPQNPGKVNFYLSFDGHTPISQVISFEYRASPMDNGVGAPEDKSASEEFQVQIRLARLLFSTNNSLNILTSKISPAALKEAKKFALAISSIDKDWAYLMKSIGKNEISFQQAKNNLFEMTLKNKLQEWLLEKVIEGCKSPGRDRQGQGILHLCAILGYTWAIRPYSHSGLSLDFRDSHGWTALHWAAFRGREKMVAVLLFSGANPSLVADPTSEFPGGCTAADLASKNGHDGLAAYLAEKGLTEHFRRMSLSGNISGSLQTSTADTVNPGNLTEQQLCQKDTLTAYRTAAEAASRIQSAFRENSLKLRTKAVQVSNPEIEARNIVAAMRIQHAFRNYETKKRIKAAASIQHRFRSWKVRKEFLNMRRQAIKIQAAFRGLLERRQYRKIIWSVGVLEKAIFRWRQKRKGFRGLQVEATETVPEVEKSENDVEEDFFKISRRQAEERIERSVVRVQTLFRSFRAQQDYRRMKMAYDQAQLEELLDSDVGMDG